MGGCASVAQTLFSQPDVIEIALTKLNWLLNCWNKLLSAGAGSNEDPMELNFGRLEGLALVFLCSARSKVRLKAWEMTELLRSLSQAGAHLRGHDADEAPGRGKASLKGAGGETSDAVRLRTVLEEMESDTIQVKGARRGRVFIIVQRPPDFQQRLSLSPHREPDVSAL